MNWTTILSYLQNLAIDYIEKLANNNPQHMIKMKGLKLNALLINMCKLSLLNFFRDKDMLVNQVKQR